MKLEDIPAVVRRPQRFANTDPWKHIPWKDEPRNMTPLEVVEWVLAMVALGALIGITWKAFG